MRKLLSGGKVTNLNMTYDPCFFKFAPVVLNQKLMGNLDNLACGDKLFSEDSL